MLTVFDPDRLSEVVAGSGLDHRQIEPGRFEAHIRRFEIDGLNLDTGRYSRAVWSNGSFRPGFVTLGFILSAIESGVVINGRRFAPGDLAVFPGDVEYGLSGARGHPLGGGPGGAGRPRRPLERPRST